jgi:hypothetical protein
MNEVKLKLCGMCNIRMCRRQGSQQYLLMACAPKLLRRPICGFHDGAGERAIFEEHLKVL